MLFTPAMADPSSALQSTITEVAVGTTILQSAFLSCFGEKMTNSITVQLDFQICNCLVVVLFIDFVGSRVVLTEAFICSSLGRGKRRHQLSAGLRWNNGEVGDGKRDSWFMPLMKQIKIVKTIHALGDGYNLVAYSQGNMVARGLIEFCDDAPKINNYVSVAGPHAGIAYVPYCGSEELCKISNRMIKGLGVYNDFVQEHLAPSGYIKIPNDMESYLRGNRFLPYINNEIVDKRNATYKERFISLNKLVLVMFENDKVLIPRETSWFGFYSENNGSIKSLPLPAKRTKLYTEDWIGLKTLDEAGKVEFFSVPGGHQSLNSSLLLNYAADYLKAQ